MNETQSELETKPSIYAVAIKYGLLTGLLYVVYATVNYITETYGNFFVSLLITSAISIVGIVLALREFRKQNAGFMTYGQGLGLGLMVSVISGLIFGVFNAVYIQFVDPGVPEKMIEASMEQMAAFGVDESVLDGQRDEILASFSPIKQITSGLTNGFLWGLVLSLIIAAIMKRKPQEFE